MKVDLRTVLILMVVILFWLAIRCTGRQEHAEDVVLQMTQEQYDEINERLGGCNDVVKIAEYYERDCKGGFECWPYREFCRKMEE